MAHIAPLVRYGMSKSPSISSRAIFMRTASVRSTANECKTKKAGHTERRREPALSERSGVEREGRGRTLEETSLEECRKGKKRAINEVPKLKNRATGSLDFARDDGLRRRHSGPAALCN